MSLYKDKASLFANIFSHLSSDSDDDENGSQRGNGLGVKRESPSKNEGLQELGIPVKSIKLDPMNESLPVVAATSKDTPAKTNNGGGDVIDISSSDGSCDAVKATDQGGGRVFYDINSSGSDCDVIAIGQDDNFVTEASRRMTNSIQTATENEEDENRTANDSSFFEDYNYKLRINRSGRYEHFNMTYKSKISDTLKDLIDELAKVGKALVLTKDGETIDFKGSPHSLKLLPGDILNAIEIQPSKYTTHTSGQATAECIDTNMIMLKLQDGNRKHSKEFQIAMDEPIGRLKQEYAKEFDIDITCMKLSFDGDIVEDQSTPEELDMDDGCVVDVLLPQTITYVAPPSPIDLVSPVKETTTPGGCRRSARRARGRGRRKR